MLLASKAASVAATRAHMQDAAEQEEFHEGYEAEEPERKQESGQDGAGDSVDSDEADGWQEADEPRANDTMEARVGKVTGRQCRALHRRRGQA